MKRKRSRRSRRKNPSSALVLREAVDLADWSKPFYRLPIVFRGSLGECIAYARSRGCQWRRHADLLYGGYWEGAQTGLSLIPDTPGNVVTPPLGSRRGPPVRRNPRRRRCWKRARNPRLSLDTQLRRAGCEAGDHVTFTARTLGGRGLIREYYGLVDRHWNTKKLCIYLGGSEYQLPAIKILRVHKPTSNPRRRKNPCLPCLLLNPRGRKRGRRRR